jgi:hypothetical protein
MNSISIGRTMKRVLVGDGNQNVKYSQGWFPQPGATHGAYKMERQETVRDVVSGESMDAAVVNDGQFHARLLLLGATIQQE